MNSLIISASLIFMGIIALTTVVIRECIEKIFQKKDVDRAQKWFDEQKGKSIDYND